jgi:GntR family L-lactate dehydrogenase operon transcriptional regulator
MSAVLERLESLIAAGKLAPGDRLPAERRLALDLGVSRSALREAIKQLASRGLLVSHHGGGTYLTSPEEAEPLRAVMQYIAPLAQSEAGYWRDVIEIRKSLEGDAAALRRCAPMRMTDA